MQLTFNDFQPSGPTEWIYQSRWSPALRSAYHFTKALCCAALPIYNVYKFVSVCNKIRDECTGRATLPHLRAWDRHYEQPNAHIPEEILNIIADYAQPMPNKKFLKIYRKMTQYPIVKERLNSNHLISLHNQVNLIAAIYKMKPGVRSQKVYQACYWNNLYQKTQDYINNPYDYINKKGMFFLRCFINYQTINVYRNFARMEHLYNIFFHLRNLVITRHWDPTRELRLISYYDTPHQHPHSNTIDMIKLPLYIEDDSMPPAWESRSEINFYVTRYCAAAISYVMNKYRIAPNVLEHINFPMAVARLVCSCRATVLDNLNSIDNLNYQQAATMISATLTEFMSSALLLDDNLKTYHVLFNDLLLYPWKTVSTKDHIRYALDGITSLLKGICFLSVACQQK